MLGAEAREANRAWLVQQVNHVLEPILLAIVGEQPTDTVRMDGKIIADLTLFLATDSVHSKSYRA